VTDSVQSSPDVRSLESKAGYPGRSFKFIGKDDPSLLQVLRSSICNVRTNSTIVFSNLKRWGDDNLLYKLKSETMALFPGNPFLTRVWPAYASSL
jgi:hypothetical protein